MAGKRFVSIGECMIEMSGGTSGQYALGFAGDTLNTAWYVRANLAPDWTVDYVTALGDDIYSDQMVDFLHGHSIGTEAIQRIAGKLPGIYLIHQHAGDRHFTYWRESSAARRLADDPEALAAAIGTPDMLYFSGITLAILAPEAREVLLERVAALRAAGVTTAFDPNIRPTLWPDAETLRETISAGARAADIVLPTHADEQPYFSDANPQATADRYRALGAREVVVKNGAAPALVAAENTGVLVDAVGNTEVVDATGAGDSFNGAYLAARLMDISPEKAARTAHGIASVVIGHHGALVDPALLA